MKKHFNIILNVTIYFVLGLILFLIFFFNFKPYEQETLTDQMRYYSDSFIIPAIILICIFCMGFVSSKGAFDGVRYTFHFIGNKLIPTRSNTAKTTYYDYKMELQDKRKDLHFEGLFVGLFFLVLALIFYILYYTL